MIRAIALRLAESLAPAARRAAGVPASLRPRRVLRRRGRGRPGGIGEPARRAQDRVHRMPLDGGLDDPSSHRCRGSTRRPASISPARMRTPPARAATRRSTSPRPRAKSDCFACHEPAFRRATRPSHTGFPTACKTCHGVSAWQPATFDHNRTTFQLNGAHRSVDCVSCHRNGYTATPTECFSCHQKDFSGARNPVHAGFANTCQDCHGVSAWQPATFDHNQTGFQLLGAHRTVECTTCHRTGYAGTPVRVLLLPSDRLHRRPQSRARRLSEHLSRMPRRHRLAAGALRSQRHRLPVERRPPLHRMRELPSHRVRRHSQRLLLLPSE